MPNPQAAERGTQEQQGANQRQLKGQILDLSPSANPVGELEEFYHEAYL